MVFLVNHPFQIGLKTQNAEKQHESLINRPSATCLCFISQEYIDVIFSLELNFRHQSIWIYICSLCSKPSLATFLNYLSSQQFISLLYVNLACFQISLASLLIFPILSQKPWSTLLILTKSKLVSRLHTPGSPYTPLIYMLCIINLSFLILFFRFLFSPLKCRLSNFAKNNFFFSICLQNINLNISEMNS